MNEKNFVTNKDFARKFYGIKGYENEPYLAEMYHEELKAIHNEADKFSDTDYDAYCLTKEDMVRKAEVMSGMEMVLKAGLKAGINAIMANEKFLMTDVNELANEVTVRYNELLNISSEERLFRAIFQIEVIDNIAFLHTCKALNEDFYCKWKTALVYDIYSSFTAIADIKSYTDNKTISKDNLAECDTYNLYFREYSMGIKNLFELLHIELLTGRMRSNKDNKTFGYYRSVFETEGYSDEEINTTFDTIVEENSRAEMENIPEKDNYLVQDDLYDGVKYASENDSDEETDNGDPDCEYTADTSFETIERDFGLIPKIEKLQDVLQEVLNIYKNIAEEKNSDILEDIKTLLVNIELIRKQVLVGEIIEADGNLAMLKEDIQKLYNSHLNL